LVPDKTKVPDVPTSTVKAPDPVIAPGTVIVELLLTLKVPLPVSVTPLFESKVIEAPL